MATDKRGHPRHNARDRDMLTKDLEIEVSRHALKRYQERIGPTTASDMRIRVRGSKRLSGKRLGKAKRRMRLGKVVGRHFREDDSALYVVERMDVPYLRYVVITVLPTEGFPGESAGIHLA